MPVTRDVTLDVPVHPGRVSRLAEVNGDRSKMAAIGSMKGLNYSVQSSGAVSLEVTRTIPCPGRRTYENGVGI